MGLYLGCFLKERHHRKRLVERLSKSIFDFVCDLAKGVESLCRKEVKTLKVIMAGDVIAVVVIVLESHHFLIELLDGGLRLGPLA